MGAANLGAGLFQGFPIGSSLSKSAANDRAGARSQMSSIIAAGVTIIVALFFTQFFYALPEAALGAIVIMAVSGMVKIGKLQHLYKVRRSDFILAIVALVAVLTFETLEALLIAVVVSIFALVLRASHPNLAMLGRAPNRLDFNNIRRHPESKIGAGSADRATGKRLILRQCCRDKGSDTRQNCSLPLCQLRQCCWIWVPPPTWTCPAQICWTRSMKIYPVAMCALC